LGEQSFKVFKAGSVRPGYLEAAKGPSEWGTSGGRRLGGFRNFLKIVLGLQCNGQGLDFERVVVKLAECGGEFLELGGVESIDGGDAFEDLGLGSGGAQCAFVSKGE